MSEKNGNGGGGCCRYSDEDLLLFKNLILEKIEEAQKSIRLLRAMPEDLLDTNSSVKVWEDISQNISRENNEFLAARQEKFVRDLELALIRIKNKDYGICRVTGTLIPRERLIDVPHATLCIQAKFQQPKSKPIYTFA